MFVCGIIWLLLLKKKDKDMDEKVSTAIASSGNQNETLSHTPLG